MKGSRISELVDLVLLAADINLFVSHKDVNILNGEYLKLWTQKFSRGVERIFQEVRTIRQIPLPPPPLSHNVPKIEVRDCAIITWRGEGEMGEIPPSH